VRILVTGHDGLLGSSLVPRLREHHAVAGIGVGDGEITDAAFVTAVIREHRPERIVHLAAMTAVDRCETHPQEAYRVNEEGTRVVAAAAGDVPVIMPSTDYVFDGALGEPYAEDAPPNPLNVYGKSKLAAERALTGAPHWAVVRTAWLFGPGGPNFVDTILRLLEDRDTLSVVDDQTGSPTYTEDLAAGLAALVEGEPRGIYHVVNTGRASWCELAREAAERAGADPERVLPATTAEIARPAPRPPFSVLRGERAARETGVVLRSWRDALAEYLAGRRIPAARSVES